MIATVGRATHAALRREQRAVLAAYAAGIQAGLQSRECFD
jgi:hypothetical protein